MSVGLSDLLLIQSLNLDKLIEEYRVFFLSLLPSLFLLACLVEYFDRMDTFALVRRAFIAILILTSVASFYKSSIDMSISAADSKLQDQKSSNVFLQDFMDAGKHVERMRANQNPDFYKSQNFLNGSLKFLKHHFFTSFVNDGFTTVVYFIGQLCIQIIKVVYSLVYYLGFGLIGIPCLLYLFPTMGNILRGAILSYVWCLIVPHILVFVLSMISSEINTGYQANEIIGGSIAGTVLLFIMTLLIAFTPLIGMMIVNGSGIAQAGGVIASIGANYVMNLPKQTVNNGAMLLSGGSVGPKMSLMKSGGKLGGRALKKGLNSVNPLSKKSGGKSDSKSTSTSLSSGSSKSKSFDTSNTFSRGAKNFNRRSRTVNTSSNNNFQNTKSSSNKSNSNELKRDQVSKLSNSKIASKTKSSNLNKSTLKSVRRSNVKTNRK